LDVVQANRLTSVGKTRHPVGPTIRSAGRLVMLEL
jgi:hypothetical protein